MSISQNPNERHQSATVAQLVRFNAPEKREPNVSEKDI